MNAADIRPWRHISEIDAFASATKAQLEIMRQLAEGDRIVPAIGGRSFEFERTGVTVPVRTVDQLLHRCWLVRPEYPLFATDHHAGRLTVRGQFALANCI